MGATLGSGTRPSDLLRTIDGAVAGDERDVTDLVKHCLPPITSYLTAREAEHPEALANQVVAEVVHRLPHLSFGTREQFWNYLYKVAKSRLVDEKRGAKPDHVVQSVDDLNFAVSGFADEVIDRTWLTNMMKDLTADQKQVIHLRFLEDLSLAETAHRTGRSVNAVKSMQRRALTALAAAAAATAVIVLTIIGVRLLGAASIQVQSLQPADGGGAGIDETPDLGQRTPALTERRLEVEESPANGSLDRPLEPESGRSIPWSVATGAIGPASSVEVTSPTRPGIDANNRTADAPEETAPGSDPAEMHPTAQGPTGAPAPPSPVEQAAAEAPIPTMAAADIVPFDLMATDQLWIDVDVLYNDHGAIIADSLQIAIQPSAGLAEVVHTAAGPRLRYHPTRPGEHTMYYEVCSAELCQTTPLTVPTSWYDDAFCSHVEPTIIGTTGNDVLVGTAGNDIIFGLDGNDVINGGGGFDIICGGPGDDALSGDEDADVLIGGAGNDYLVGGASNDTLLGGIGDDQIFGGAGADVAFGGDGEDILSGDADDDSLYGEFGGDMLSGGDGDDRIFGGPGFDNLGDGNGADLLHGGPDGDALTSTNDGARNRLFGGLGADTLTGSGPLDTLDGQADHDMCSASVPAVNCESYG